jgi:hypothetical protein
MIVYLHTHKCPGNSTPSIQPRVTGPRANCGGRQALIRLKTNAYGDQLLLFMVLTVDQIDRQAGRVSESVAHLPACFICWPHIDTIRYAANTAIARS